MIELNLPRPHDLEDVRGGVVVAIDAGATKTKSKAFDLATGALSDGLSAGGNADSVGTDRAVDHIAEAINEAAGSQPIRGILLAGAGTDASLVFAGIQKRFETSGYVEFVNDVIGAWGTSFGGEDGLALISGTGSHAVGVIAGTAVRVGGWGHVFGDEGSAWALGRNAIHACLYALDGRGQPTVLSQAVEDHFHGQPIEKIVGELYRSENMKADTADLARVVDQAALGGDAVAQSIIDAAASELGDHVAALAAVLPLPEGASVGLVGSTWKSEALMTAFRAALDAQGGVVATLRASRVDREPVEGVLALLLRAAGRSDALPALGW